MACGVLVPWPGIEPVPPPWEAQSRNHWTTREVLKMVLFWPIFLGGHKDQIYPKQNVWRGPLITIGSL